MSGMRLPVLRFLLRAVAVYVLWYLLYDLWLLPDGRLDAWISRRTAQCAGVFLSSIGFPAGASDRVVQLAGASGVRVVNGCNGLSTIGLFAGFVVAFPGSNMRRLLFLPVGALVILAANAARISLLATLQLHWTTAFAWVHGLGAPSFFYLVVFGLWVLWTRIGGTRTPDPPDAPVELDGAPA